jgi:hypothetical protein
MAIIDELAHEHPFAVSAGAAGVCLLLGWELGAPILGAVLGVVAGGVTHYSWTRGSAYQRHMRRDTPTRPSSIPVLQSITGTST